MTAFLSARQVRIFDYPRFAEPLRDRVRERAAELAAGAGISRCPDRGRDTIDRRSSCDKALWYEGPSMLLLHTPR